MQIKAKALQDAAWKDILSKNKSVKDNGLLKVLADLKRLDDDAHGDALDLLDEVVKLAGQLKKDKAVAAVAAALKYIGEVIAAAESTQRELAKARAEREKAEKAKVDAEKKAAARKEADSDDDEGEDGDVPELLTVKLKPLLKLVAKGEVMHALIGKAGKKVAVMLSRKPIAPARRKVISEQLGGASVKFLVGQCSLQAGVTTFVLQSEVAGLSKLIKLALIEQTGLRLNKIKCVGDDGDDDDDDGEASSQAAAGAGDGEPAAIDEAAAAAAADAKAEREAQKAAERARRERSRALDDIETELRLLRRSFR